MIERLFNTLRRRQRMPVAGETAIAGAESARVLLAKVCQRLEAEKRA